MAASVPVALEVGAAIVSLPAGVLELDTHSSSEADPSESSLPPVSVAHMVSPFLFSDDSKSDTEMPKRHNPTAPITPAQSVVVAPSTNIISPVDASSGIRRRHAILIRPGQDIPIGRLYHTHPGGPCKALTVRKLVRPLPSHRLALRYTSHHLDRFTSRSSDRGTMEVGVDVVDGIDNPNGMLMPDAVEHLEQVEEGLQDIYDHVMEIPLQRIEDIKTGQREFEVRSLISGRERASLLNQVVSL
ncbi:hypothetical protein Tco_0578185 [Tanacetum coccineum]